MQTSDCAVRLSPRNSVFTALVSAAQVDPTQVAICGEASEQNNYTHTHMCVCVERCKCTSICIYMGSPGGSRVGVSRRGQERKAKNLSQSQDVLYQGRRASEFEDGSWHLCLSLSLSLSDVISALENVFCGLPLWCLCMVCVCKCVFVCV